MAAVIGADLSLFTGALTAYLVASAWLTVRRRAGQIGHLEWMMPLVGLSAALGCIVHGARVLSGDLVELAAGEPIPAEIYFFYGGVALLAGAGDVRLLVQGGIAGRRRIARHIWRMGFALITAAASFFLGQPQVFPAFLHGVPGLLHLPVLAFVLLTLFWWLRVTLGYGGPAVPTSVQVIGSAPDFRR